MAGGHNAGGGFGSPFMGGAPAHAASVFRGGLSAFPALSSTAPQPVGLSSLQTLSAPADTLPQVCPVTRGIIWSCAVVRRHEPSRPGVQCTSIAPCQANAVRGVLPVPQ